MRRQGSRSAITVTGTLLTHRLHCIKKALVRRTAHHIARQQTLAGRLHTQPCKADLAWLRLRSESDVDDPSPCEHACRASTVDRDRDCQNERVAMREGGGTVPGRCWAIRSAARALTGSSVAAAPRLRSKGDVDAPACQHACRASTVNPSP